mgnify:CR=1 FL=1
MLLAFSYFMCTVDIPHYYTHWLEDEAAGKRFTRLDVSEIENVVDLWLDESDKVAERRGED